MKVNVPQEQKPVPHRLHGERLSRQAVRAERVAPGLCGTLGSVAVPIFDLARVIGVEKVSSLRENA